LDRDAVFSEETTPSYVATTYSLKHINAMQAAGQLRVFAQDPQNLTTITAFANNSLIITGFRPTVARILQMIGEIDRAGTAFASVEERISKLEKRLAAVESRLGPADDKK